MKISSVLFLPALFFLAFIFLRPRPTQPLKLVAPNCDTPGGIDIWRILAPELELSKGNASQEVLLLRGWLNLGPCEVSFRRRLVFLLFCLFLRCHEDSSVNDFPLHKILRQDECSVNRIVQQSEEFSLSAGGRRFVDRPSLRTNPVHCAS